MDGTAELALMIIIPFICIGVIFIGIGYVVTYFMKKRVRRCSETVLGKVVDADEFQVRVNFVRCPAGVGRHLGNGTSI